MLRRGLIRGTKLLETGRSSPVRQGLVSLFNQQYSSKQGESFNNRDTGATGVESGKTQLERNLFVLRDLPAPDHSHLSDHQQDFQNALTKLRQQAEITAGYHSSDASQKSTLEGKTIQNLIKDAFQVTSSEKSQKLSSSDQSKNISLGLEGKLPGSTVETLLKDLDVSATEKPLTGETKDLQLRKIRPFDLEKVVRTRPIIAMLNDLHRGDFPLTSRRVIVESVEPDPMTSIKQVTFHGEQATTRYKLDLHSFSKIWSHDVLINQDVYAELDKTIKSERSPLAVVSAEQMLNQADQVRTQYPNEVDQLKHYFSLHYEKVAQSLQATRGHFDSGNFHDLDDTNLMTLDHAVTGLKKALKRIDFRVKYPTAQDVLLSHTIPEDSMKYFQGFQDEHWRIIAEKRAKKEGVAFTEEYYHQYKADLAEKSRLSDGQSLWVCREFATFEAGLDEGCVLSSMEAETTGTKNLRSQRCDPKAIFMQAAKKLFGYTSQELSPEVYFTYMTIGKPDQEWGDVAIRAKPEARQRATKLFYPTSISTTGPQPSSLCARPIALDQTGIDCFPLKGTFRIGDTDLNSFSPLYVALHNTHDPLDFKSIDDIKPWAEAQIHGGMTVDDIEEVTFSQPINDKDRREKIKGLLDQYHIKHNL